MCEGGGGDQSNFKDIVLNDDVRGKKLKTELVCFVFQTDDLFDILQQYTHDLLQPEDLSSLSELADIGTVTEVM